MALNTFVEAIEDPAKAITILPPLPVSSLQEMNHRVANSLQLITAMLHCQSCEIADPHARDAIDDARRRITAIADTHRHLCHAPDEAIIDLATYLIDLANGLEDCHGRSVEFRRLRVEAEQILVPAEFASAMGILVTELVINACKHAYRPREQGDIDIRLARAGKREFWLAVQDYGSQRPDNAGRPSNGLGSHIIDMMSRRIGIRHGYVPAPCGTRFLVCGLIPASTD